MFLSYQALVHPEHCFWHSLVLDVTAASSSSAWDISRWLGSRVLSASGSEFGVYYSQHKEGPELKGAAR
jgi:hypothetical protein